MKREKKITMTILIMLQLCSVLSTFATAEEEGEARWQSHFQDDAEIAIPEILPDYDETMKLMVNIPEGQIAAYDVHTGVETVLDTNPQDMSPEAWIPGMEEEGSEASEGQFSPMVFSGFYRVNDPEKWPWKPNCKVYYTRRGTRYQASGVLLDAYHVLCAGHSIHEGCGGNWSSNVVVVPAYHGGSRPYGDAKSIRLFSWSGWTVYGDTKHDMGLIRLDRPVGALTGWLGYGWTSDTSFYTQAVFNNPGYPAAGQFSGQFMYNWCGRFDFMSYPCAVMHGRGVAGQGGSGAYCTKSGHHYVYAVFSGMGTGSNYNRTYFPIITGTKFDHIKNWIGAYTPSRFDLLALDVMVSPDIICAGQTLGAMSYRVYNHSSVSRTGTFYVDVYLSRNDNISTADRKIDRHYFTRTIGPKDSVSISVSNPPTIPYDVTSGDYYIGVILDVPDYFTSNNDSDGQEAAPIRILW